MNSSIKHATFVAATERLDPFDTGPTTALA